MRLLKWVTVLCLGLYFLAGLWLYINQRHYIYEASDEQVSAKALPGFSRKTMIYAKDQTLSVWLHTGKPMLVYFRGNKGSIADYYKDVKPFIDQGWGSLLVDYPGYSGNPGQPTEKGIYQTAIKSLQFIKHIPTSCTVFMGRSLGTGVATFIARQYDAAALVLLSPFTSIIDIAKQQYPIFPVQWLLKDSFNSLSRIQLINMPLLVLHGTEDQKVPYALGAALYEKAKQPKKMISLYHTHHTNLPRKKIANAVIQFSQKWLNQCRE